MGSLPRCGRKDPQGGERQVNLHTAVCSVADTSCPASFSARFIPSSQHTLPASVAVVLMRAPRNIFLVTGGVSNRLFPE